MQLPSDVSVFTYRVRVGYVDTDRGDVVHHGTYLRYLEAARVELMRARNLDYKSFELVDKLALPVAEAVVRYRLPARFDDQLELRTWVAVANRAKIRFDTLIFRDDALLTHAEITLACIRLPEGKICSMPPSIIGLADAHLRGKR